MMSAAAGLVLVFLVVVPQSLDLNHTLCRD